MKNCSHYNIVFFPGVVTLLFFLIAGCASTDTPPGGRQENTVVAVWDLDNLSPQPTAIPDLGEIMAAKVIEVFRSSPAITVVERERLRLALEELNLGTSEVVDESTRLQLGRLVQAQQMVFGSYMVIEDVVRIDLRLVDVQTGVITGTAQKMAAGGDLDSWFAAAEEAAREISISR
jgi:PBP1b-binding outer membrane lipoprotein LpoB